MISKVKDFPKREWVFLFITLYIIAVLNVALSKEVFEPIFFLVAVFYLGFYALSSRYSIKIRLANACIGGYFIARFLDSIVGVLSRVVVSSFT